MTLGECSALQYVQPEDDHMANPGQHHCPDQVNQSPQGL